LFLVVGRLSLASKKAALLKSVLDPAPAHLA
jgi:hypothetical protein